MSSLPVRPLPTLLAYFEPGNLAADSIPGFRRSRLVGGRARRRSGLRVEGSVKGRLAQGMRGVVVHEVTGAISPHSRGDACGVCFWFAQLVV